MIKFKKLFNFSKSEIDKAFQNSSLVDQILGLKLLASSQIKEQESPQKHGKLLVVIPGKAGKAHERNLIKRRVKAIYYEEKLYQKPIISILLVYKQAKELNFDELKKFLIKNLR